MTTGSVVGILQVKSEPNEQRGNGLNLKLLPL